MDDYPAAVRRPNASDIVVGNPKAQPGNLTTQSLTSRQKCEFLRKQLRVLGWSLSDLIEAWVIAEKEPGEEQQATTGRQRAKQLAEAISKPNVMVQLQPYMLEKCPYLVSTKDLEREVRRLSETPEFGRWTKHSHELPDTRQAFNQVDKLGPGLMKIFAALRPVIGTTTVQQTIDSYRKKVVFGVAWLTAFSKPTKGSRMQRSVGLFLQGTNTSRRVIDALCGMGVCSSSKTIYLDAVDLGQQAVHAISQFGARQDTMTVFDNFDYMERTGHTGIGQADELIHLTTAKAFKGQDIADSGILSSELNQSHELTLDEVLASPGNTESPEIEAVARFIIAEALYDMFKPELKHVFGSDSPTTHADWPKMPIIDRLEPKKTEHTTLNLIFENEGSLDGTMKVLDNIFHEQYGLNAENTDGSVLRLVYGDQKTVSNIRSVRKQDKDNDGPFEQRQWTLPVPGLFHLKMCLTQAMLKNFGDGEASNKKSSLEYHRLVMDRKTCPALQQPFSHQERLVLDSLKARIIAFALEYMQDHCRNVHLDIFGTIRACIRAMTISGFNHMINGIYDRAFAPNLQFDTPISVKDDIKKSHWINAGGVQADAHQKAIRKAELRNKPPPPTPTMTGTEDRMSHIRFIATAQVYWLLKYSIKHADIGLLRMVIDRCVLIFHARSHKNYAFVMLWLKWLTDTNATSPALGRAILANGLFNNKGRSNSWFEIDKANEHLNRHLKDILAIRRNGSFGVRGQLQQSALLASFMGEMRDSFAREYGRYIGGEHITRTSGLEILKLAVHCMDTIRGNSLDHGECAHYAMDLFSVGAMKLSEGPALANFNARVRDTGNPLRDNNNEDIAYDDQVDDAEHEAYGSSGQHDISMLPFLLPDPQEDARLGLIADDNVLIAQVDTQMMDMDAE